MLVNVPTSISNSTEKSVRSLFVHEFADGSGFIFNAENPSGVKYLPKATFSTYCKLLAATQGALPYVNLNIHPEYSDFVAHGLAYDEKGFNLPTIKTKHKAITVWFHISNACNLSCRYCYIPKLKKAVDLEGVNPFLMSAETAKKATESLFDFCISNGFTHLQIKFAGGEPTLNLDQIEEVCDYAQKLSEKTKINIGFRILTNAVFLTDKVFEVFKKFRFGVSISVDGDKDRHDEIRFTIPQSRAKSSAVGKEGTWNIIEENIGILIRMGIKPYILCTVTELNYKNLLNLVKYCVQNSIGFRFSPVRDKKSHTKPDLEQAILSELITVYDWLGDNLPSHMPVERFARFAEWNLAVKKQRTCGSCTSMMSIDQEGNVASCQMRMDKPMGNIQTNSLDSIFNTIKSSPDNYYITNPEMKTEDCSVCYWRFSCSGGCPEHTRMVYKTTNSPSPWCGLYQGLLPHYLLCIAKQIKRTVD